MIGLPTNLQVSQHHYTKTSRSHITIPQTFRSYNITILQTYIYFIYISSHASSCKDPLHNLVDYVSFGARVLTGPNADRIPPTWRLAGECLDLDSNLIYHFTLPGDFHSQNLPKFL